MGESAGGYLASVVGLTDPRIRAVVDEFGAADLSVLADGFDERMRSALADPRHPVNPVQRHPDEPGRSGRGGRACVPDPARRRRPIIPPAQTLALHYALRDACADSTHHLLAGAGHGMLSLNRRQARQWASVQVLTLITELLDRTLRT